MNDGISFRVVCEADAPALLEIYAPYVLNTAVSFEYDVPSIEEFQQRIRSTLQKFPYIAAVQNGKIIGYAYASPFKLREAYKYSVELSIYLSGECRRKGVGSRLYGLLEQILAAQGILNLNACITYGKKEENPYTSQDSVLFHEKMGYRLVGKFSKCGFKFGFTVVDISLVSGMTWYGWKSFWTTELEEIQLLWSLRNLVW